MPRGVITTLETPTPPALTPTEDGATTQGAAYRLDVPALSTEPLRVTAPDGTTLSWRPTDLWYVDEHGMLDPIVGSLPASVETIGRQATYRRTFPACDDLFVAEASRVKHYIVLHERPRQPAPYLTGRVDFCISGIVECRDVKGNPTPLPEGQLQRVHVGPFELPDAFAVDLAGQRCDGTYEVLPADAVQQLFVRIDAAWLLDPDRAYPVAVDPTISPTTIGDALRHTSMHAVRPLSDGSLVAVLRTEADLIEVLRSTNSGQIWGSVAELTVTRADNVDFAVDDADNLHVSVACAYQDSYYKTFYYLGRWTADKSDIIWSSGLLLLDKSTDEFDMVTSIDVQRDPTGGGGWWAHIMILYHNPYTSADWHGYARVAVSSSYGVSLAYGPTQFGGTAPTGDWSSGPYLFLRDQNTLVAVWVWNGLLFCEATRSGSTWTWGTVRRLLTSTNNIVSETVLAKAAVLNGYYYLAFIEVDNTNDIRVFRAPITNTTSWTNITPSFMANVDYAFVDMCTAEDGKLYLFYSPESGGLYYITYDGSAWGSVATIDGGTTRCIPNAARIPYGVLCAYRYYSTNTGVFAYRIMFNEPPREPTVGIVSAFDASGPLNVYIAQNDEGDTMSGCYLKVGSQWWTGSGFVDTEPATPLPASGTYTYVTIPGGTFTVGQTYQFSAATVDSRGVKGPYLSVPIVAKATIKPVVTVLEPVPNAVLTSPILRLRASMTVADGAQPQYYFVWVELTSNGADVATRTFTSSGSIDVEIDTGLPNGASAQVRVLPQDSDGAQGAPVIVPFSVDFTDPEPIINFTTTRDPSAGTIRLQWQSGAQPDIWSGQYEVFRDGERIAVVSHPDTGDPSYTDHAVASGRVYTYGVRATGSNGTKGPLVEAAGSVTFEGWRFAPRDDLAGEVVFAFDWTSRRQRDEDRYEVVTRGRYPITFRGPSRPFRLNITALFDDEGGLTAQEWADRIYALSGTLGYLRSPDGGIWYGELYSPSDDWNRDLVRNGRTVQIQFVEKGPVSVGI